MRLKVGHFVRSVGAIRLQFPYIIAAVFLAGSLQADNPVNPDETGIRGTVMCGPVVPGPTRAGQIEEAPLRASFYVLGAGRKVAAFESDDQGGFELLLPAGEYTIVPARSTPIPFPERQTTTVNVPEKGFAVVTIKLDTGMK